MQLPVLKQVETGGRVPDREAIALGLRGVVRGEVRFGRHDRLLYATDASMYQVEPIGVVVPADEADLAVAVAWCGHNGVAMLARGGGTSLAGQSTSRAVVLDTSVGLRGVREISDSSAYAEAGVYLDDLNAAIAKAGVASFFAPDPATAAQATVGGCIGNNAAGARSVKYGRTSENVLAIDAVLADGARVRFEAGAGKKDRLALELARGVREIVARHERLIRERYPKTIRQNAGYGLDRIARQMVFDAPAEELDLAQLLCGSEGTLAVTLGAELLLHRRPGATGLALMAFPSVDAAIEAVIPILALRPSAVELVDDVVIEAARGNIECSRYVDAFPKVDGCDPAAVLYVEFQERAAGEVEADCRQLASTFRGTPVRVVTDPSEIAGAWKLRKAGEPLLHGLPGKRKPITFIEDNVVPPERLGEFVRRLRAVVEREGTRAAFWAHASVGVLHVRPMIDPHDAADQERMKRIAVEAADIAKDCGGVMSGEHGDGRVRGPLLERHFGPELMRAFREVKALFDPKGLLNPGNIVEPGPIASIVERTRIEPGRGAGDGGAALRAAIAPVQTYYDYEDHHGFSGAVERCNGAGVCRKTAGGTMCPSYRATLDERHSTRGRGNALRLAISGQFSGAGGEASWDDPGTMETLRLCLSCKACKSECPSNVDVARLKAEYTAQRHKRDGVPLRSMLIGHVRMLNRIGGAAPWLANAALSLPPVAWLTRAVMGMHPARAIPRFSTPLPKLADRWLKKQREAIVGPRVVLFTDCFTGYNESNVGLAAVRVLTRLGYRVEVVNPGCCGRSMISVGMLEEAIRTVDATAVRLQEAARGAAAVLVLEPSCLSAIKDDWQQLKLREGRKAAQEVAARAMLAEEFIDAAWDRHPRRLEVAAELPIRAVLHAHCHQKALWGAKSSAGALRRVLGERLQTPDTGCCGMAGSFGFDRDKYEVSMAIGNLARGGILPIARAAETNTVLCAPGVSCRQQIREGASREAVHPVELIDALTSTRADRDR